MQKIEIKYHNWDEVPISVFKRIREAGSEDGMERTVDILAAVCGVESERIWNLPVGEVGGLVSKTGWVNSFSFDGDYRPEKIVISGVTYVCNSDISKFTVSQYVDFSTYVKKYQDYMAELMACVFIPSGHTYGNGYDVAETVRIFEDSITITTFNAVCFFLLRKSAGLTRDMLGFLKRESLRMGRKMMAKRAEAAEKMMAMFGFR